MSESREPAETGHYHSSLSRIGSALDEFCRFEHPDAQQRRSAWMNSLDRALPREGIGIDGVVRELENVVIPNGSPVAKPGFTAYITTGATTAAVLATTAASVASPQRYLLTAFNFLEDLSLRWMAEMFGIAHLEGVYSSGGSVANLLALGAARQAAFERNGRDPAADGVDRPSRIYASRECHHTIQRACGVLGLGRRAVRLIDCDSAGRMEPGKLEDALREDEQEDILPVAIVANAGTTNQGAIDPLRAIGEIAAERTLWFHVDGAYGLPGILDERLSDQVPRPGSGRLRHRRSAQVARHLGRHRVSTYRQESRHPAPCLHPGSRRTTLRDRSNRPESEPADIEHSLDDFGIRWYDYGVELSAPCRGVAVWAVLREIGVDGLRQRIRRHNDMASDLARRARAHPKLELLGEPTLSVCCFRYVHPAVRDLDRLNRRLHRRLVRENVYLPSTTVVDGRLAIRPCFIGAQSEPAQVEGLVDAVLRIGAELVD